MCVCTEFMSVNANKDISRLRRKEEEGDAVSQNTFSMWDYLVSGKPFLHNNNQNKWGSELKGD